MAKNPPENTPRVTPYLYYRDVAGALRFLSEAFGFREKLRMPDKDGDIAHAQGDQADAWCDGHDDQRIVRNARRTWSTNSSGCSHAAKCPPRSGCS